MRIKKNTFLYTIPFFILLFQQAIINNTTGLLNSMFSYLDEFYVVLLLLLLIKNNGLNKLKKDKNDFIIFILWCIFLIVGLVSGIISRYVPVQWLFIDAFICSKFLIVYFSIKYCGDRIINISGIVKGCKYCVLLFAFGSVLNIFIPLFPRGEYRYIMDSVQLFFGHPTFYAAASITCVCVMIAGEAFTKNKLNEKFIYLGLLCVFSTLRMKAIAAALGVLFLYIYFIKLKLKNKKIAILFAAVVALLLGYDQISFYYGDNYLYDENFIRARMMRDSFKIANQLFPLGSGFGSFASDAARKAHSILYSVYNYSLDSKFLTDTFWPIVIAQCGWIGLIAFCTVIEMMMKSVFNVLKQDRWIFCSSCSIMLYLLIATSGESAFFHPVCIPMFMLIGFNSKNMMISRKQGDFR